MAVNGVSSNTTSTESTSSLGGTSNGTVDKDAFLKLLVAQLSHQDPLQPTEGTEFVTQLAQFSTVEQQIAQSAKLDLISLQLRGLSSNEAAGLVGKTVTVKGDGVVEFKDGVAQGSTTSLDEAAKGAKIQLVDANGNVVASDGPRDLAAGPVPTDGFAAQGKDIDGKYTVKVVDAQGTELSTGEKVTGVVTKVSFDKGYPELVLDNGVTVPVSDLISVEGGTTSGGASGNAASGTNLAGLNSSLLSSQFLQLFNQVGQ